MIRMLSLGCGSMIVALACAGTTADDDGVGAATSSRAASASAGGSAGAGVGGVAVGGAGGDAEGGQGGAGGAGACSNQVSPAACYACCAAAYPSGERILELQFGACGCHPGTCYPECTPWVCGQSGAPDDACATCIEEVTSNNGGCAMDATFQSNCLNVADCANLLACLSDCTP